MQLGKFFQGQKLQGQKLQGQKLQGQKLALAMTIALSLLSVKSVSAFCGFFVAKVETNMYNNKSEVAIAREGNNTTYNLSFDYKGDPQEFALVLPVPIVLKKADVRVIDAKLFQRLSDFTAPRLVRYNVPMRNRGLDDSMPRSAPAPANEQQEKVRVVERFTVGEYDVVILDADESSALVTWLDENNYKLPKNAGRYLQSYIDNKMFFFVVKVNLEAKEKLGFQELRPIQFTVKNSSNIMLPFQLGKINSEGTQNIILYVLSDKGRAEARNYTNVMIPSNFNVPQEIEPKFGQFYQDLLKATIKATGRETVVTEYAWDTGSCDPCSGDPLTAEELKSLGINKDQAFITRLHLQYTKNTYNRDLFLRVTNDRNNHQGRYILTPKTALPTDEAGNRVPVQAPYGLELSNVRLKPLFQKYK